MAEHDAKELTEYQTILVETRGRVGWITLNRPEALNSITPDVVSGVNAALDRAASDNEL